MKNSELEMFENTVIQEIFEIVRSEKYLDSNKDKLPQEIPVGVLTNFEKAAYSLYQRDILKYRDIVNKISTLIKSGGNIDGLEMSRKVLFEKIRTVSELFTFQLRSRLNLWHDCIVNIRKGFQVVLVEVHWTKVVEKSEAEAMIEKELGVNTTLRGQA